MINHINNKIKQKQDILKERCAKCEFKNICINGIFRDDDYTRQCKEYSNIQNEIYQLQQYLNNSEIIPVPKEFKNADYFKVIKANNIQSNNIYLTGKIGSGKSYAGCSLLIKEFLKKRAVMYISDVELITRLRNNFDDFDKIIRKIQKAEVLFYDDLGSVSKITDLVLDVYYLIYDYRYSNNLTTITASNYNIKDLAIRLISKTGETVMSERIISRIKGLTEQIIEIKGNDRR